MDVPTQVELAGPVVVSEIEAPVQVGPVDATTVQIASQYATPRRITSSASSVTLSTENPDRVGMTIYNDSTANLYVKLGITASTTDYSFLLYAGSMWEMGTRYTGRVDGIWASANGGAQVTELF